MKKTLCLSVFLASLQFCLGQPAQISFYFDPETAPVWDVTGEYVPEHYAYSGGQTNPVAFLLGLNHDANGRIRSSGGTAVLIGSDVVAALYDATGSVSGGGGSATRVNFSVRLRGYDQIAGAARRFSISLNYKLTVDPVEGALVGKVSGSVYLSGIGNARIKQEDVYLPLPEAANGSWTITLNIISMGSIGGTGTFAISDFTPVDHPAGFPTDRLLPATVSGSYSQNTGLSKVSVKGIYEGRGNSVSLTFNPDGNSVEKLSGKVLGQSVRIP